MSTAPSKAPNAQHPSQHTSPHSSASKGALVGHSIPTAVQLPHPEPEPSPAPSISFFPFSWKLQGPTATPSTSSSQCSFTFNLHRCKSTTQGKRESAFFSSQRWRDALFSLVQPPFLKAPCVIWTCCPLPSLPMKEIRFPYHHLHCCNTKQQISNKREKASKTRNSWWKNTCS